MSVKELQALTQKFADAFDQRDLKPAIEMLAEDVEVFEYAPYRLDGKQMFAKHVNEAYEGIVSASFGFRQYGNWTSHRPGSQSFSCLMSSGSRVNPSKSESCGGSLNFRIAR